MISCFCEAGNGWAAHLRDAGPQDRPSAALGHDGGKGLPPSPWMVAGAGPTHPMRQERRPFCARGRGTCRGSRPIRPFGAKASGTDPDPRATLPEQDYLQTPCRMPACWAREHQNPVVEAGGPLDGGAVGARSQQRRCPPDLLSTRFSGPRGDHSPAPAGDTWASSARSTTARSRSACTVALVSWTCRCWANSICPSPGLRTPGPCPCCSKSVGPSGWRRRAWPDGHIGRH